MSRMEDFSHQGIELKLEVPIMEGSETAFRWCWDEELPKMLALVTAQQKTPF